MRQWTHNTNDDIQRLKACVCVFERFIHECVCAHTRMCGVCMCVCVNKPDIVVVVGGQREVLILEVSCSFDCSMEQAFSEILLKYQPIKSRLDSLGYRWKLVALIFVSLGCKQYIVLRYVAFGSQA